VLLQRPEPVSHYFPKIHKSVAQDVHKLTRKFERRLFKFQTLARLITQQKAKVNVEQMSLCINHNVLVVSVFNLQCIAGQTVRCQTIHKVALSLLKRLRIPATKLSLEKVN
jgi:hypothetical protein